MRLHLLIVITVCASACASNRVTTYIAPSNETIETGTEMSLSGDSHIIFVHNHSTVPIVVTGLHLTDCENIRNRCEVQILHIPVSPGQRVNIATVRPENTTRAYNFRYNYSWEAARQQTRQ